MKQSATVPADGSSVQLKLALTADLSKVAIALIEKLSAAAGVAYEPVHRKRLARADTAVAKIRKRSEIELASLERRALARRNREEVRRQANMERITALAIEDLDPGARSKDMEDDWVALFFDRCRLVSDAQMQTLWGRLLAGEANRPGSFSRRTVHFVSTLEKADAHLFTSLCKFCWVIDGSPTPLIHSRKSSLCKRLGLTFDSLTHLDSIGLIRFHGVGGFVEVDLPQRCRVSYFDRHLEIEFPEEPDHRLEAGEVLLTQAGKQLAPISGATPSDEIFEHICQRWERYGYKVFSTPAWRAVHETPADSLARQDHGRRGGDGGRDPAAPPGRPTAAPRGRRS